MQNTRHEVHANNLARIPRGRTTHTAYHLRKVMPNTLGLHAVYTDHDGTTWTRRADLLGVAKVEAITTHADGRTSAREAGLDVVLVDLDADGCFVLAEDVSGYAGPCKPGGDALKVTHCLSSDLIRQREQWAKREGITELIVADLLADEQEPKR